MTDEEIQQQRSDWVNDIGKQIFDATSAAAVVIIIVPHDSKRVQCCSRSHCDMGRTAMIKALQVMQESLATIPPGGLPEGERMEHYAMPSTQ